MSFRHDERGMALLAVLVVIMLLSLLGGLVLYLSGQESQLSMVRYRGAQSLNIAEGGAWAARAALMAIVNADPTDAAVLEGVDTATMQEWWAEGVPHRQRPFKFLDHLVVEGEKLSVGVEPQDEWVAFKVDWSRPNPSRPNPKLKLEFLGKGQGSPPPDPFTLGSVPSNPLGEGRYRAVVLLIRVAVPHPSCAGGDRCFVLRTGQDHYTMQFQYRAVSEGHVDPQFRRRVSLSGEFAIVVGNQSFAQWALFTDVHGREVWFTSHTSFDGPVHTNGEFRFASFPKFGIADAQTPCQPERIARTRITSTSEFAWFNNRGSPVRLRANENVDRSSGARIDAPVLPDCTPDDVSDDSDNPPAWFDRGFDANPRTRRIEPIAASPNSYNHKGISIGRDAGDTSPVTPRQIREAVPELRDNGRPVPPGIYIPRARDRYLGVEAFFGGIYVEGSLQSLTFGPCRSDTRLSCYYFVHSNGQTVTLEVNRLTTRVTVENSDWDPETPGNQPGTRTFHIDPYRWFPSERGLGGGAAPMVIYVEGDIGDGGDRGLSGIVRVAENVTVVARGRIDIVGHVRYEQLPNWADADYRNSGVLGLYSVHGDIRIRRTAPRDLVLHAVLMAGAPGANDGYRSSVFVEDHDRIECRGAVHLLGGIIQEYYGPFGTFDPANGSCLSGYALKVRHDRRMSLGFSPPFFPIATMPAIQPIPLGHNRPAWNWVSWREERVP